MEIKWEQKKEEKIDGDSKHKIGTCDGRGTIRRKQKSTQQKDRK